MKAKSWLGERAARIKDIYSRRKPGILRLYRKIMGIWSSLHISAAALAYYTLTGIVPLCMFFTVLSEITRTAMDVSPAMNVLIPKMGHELESLNDIAQNGLVGLFEKYADYGWIAICLIIFLVYGFISNVQNAFNKIWDSQERPLRQSISFYVAMALGLVLIVGLLSFVFNRLESMVGRYVVLFASLLACISAAYRFIPYDKKPSFKAVAAGSLVSSVLLLLFSMLLPWIVSGIMQLEFDGIKVLLFVFWLFWAWFICLFGAVLCRRIDKGGRYYMEEEIAQLAPDYRRFLTLLVVSHIYRRYAKEGYVKGGLTYDQIRKGMFSVEGVDGSETDNPDACLPMPLLDGILEDLVSAGILIVNQENEVKYIPDNSCFECGRDYKDYTIGDILFILDSYGRNYQLDYPYWKLEEPLEAEMSEAVLKMYAGGRFDTRVMDLVPDRKLDKADEEDGTVRNEQKKSQYLSYKNGNPE